MTDDASKEAAGAAAGGPVPPARAMPPFTIRKVPPLTAEERQARRDAMDRAIQFGAAPYRDGEGKARYVFFKEANNAPVEAWRRDPRPKRGFRKTQQARKAAGQLIWHPEDQIELAKRLGVIHYREGRSAEGAAERGLYDAIWRYEHVWDTFTTPRRIGPLIIETGRVAAVAEEEVRKLQAEDPKARGGFFVRDRKNNGLIYVVPNPDPDAVAEETISGGEGADSLAGDAGGASGRGSDEIVVVEEPVRSESEVSHSTSEPDSSVDGNVVPKLNYPDILLPTLEPTWQVPPDSADDGPEPPIINMEKDRIENILENKPATFEIAESQRAKSTRTWYERHAYGYYAVSIYQDVIEYEASRQGVDPDLVKAIMYFENVRGYYGRVPDHLGLSDTILPMNIDPETWGRLVGPNANFNDPFDNIKAGVKLIRRIIERLKTPTVAKVASIYNFTGYENVSDNGARVAEFYKTKPWEQKPPKLREGLERYLNLRRDALKQRIPEN